MANAQILVTAAMSIKVTGIFIANSFVLQLRRHTGTHIFTSVHLMYISNDSFLCREFKKILVSNFFSNSNLFSTGTATTNKPVPYF